MHTPNMFFNSLEKKFAKYSSRTDLSPRQVLREFVIHEEGAAGPGSDVIKVMEIIKGFTRGRADRDELQVYFCALMARKGLCHLQSILIDQRGLGAKWQLSAVKGDYDREAQSMLRYMRFENRGVGWTHYAPIYDDGSYILEKFECFSEPGWQSSEA